MFLGVYLRQHLSHKNSCFQCNIAITNFLVSNMCEIRFNDIIGQSTVPMYSYARIPVLEPYFLIQFAGFSYSM